MYDYKDEIKRLQVELGEQARIILSLFESVGLTREDVDRSSLPHDQLILSRVKVITLPRTVDQIRSEISTLEAELSTLSNTPLLIRDQGGTYHDIPNGGALLTYSPANSQYGYEEWHPTVESAKAKLLEIGRQEGCTPDKSGLNLDVSPAGAQYSSCYYITRLEKKKKSFVVNIYRDDKHTHTYDVKDSLEEAEKCADYGRKNHGYSWDEFRVEENGKIHHEYNEQIRKSSDYLKARNG